jgi:hypothetical protein
MKKILLGIFIVAIIIFFCSCSNDKQELQKLITELEANLSLMSEKYAKLFDEQKELESELTSLQSKNFHLRNESGIIKDEILSWTKKRPWDEIKITHMDRTPHSVTLIDHKLLDLSPYFLGTIRYGFKPEADSIQYMYEFKKENEIFILNIYTKNIFEYNQEFFQCTGDLYALGEAFIPYGTEWLETENILNLIFYSSLYVGEKQFALPIIKSPKTESIAYFISELEITDSPSQSVIGELFEVLHFYNHGNEVIIYIYSNYLKILYNMNEYWYHGDEITPAKDLISILTAG